MSKFLSACCCAIGATTLFAGLPSDVTLLEFVETTGYEYADTGVYPNPKRTRVKANFQVVALPEKSYALVGLFGCTPTKNDFQCYENCTCFYGWVNGYSQWRTYPKWTGGASDGYFTTGIAAREGFEIECYKATAYVNGAQCGGYYDGKRPDKTLACSLYIGNVNNANQGLATAAGKMPKIRWYRFEVWLDDAKVADFVPATKGDQVGFYDQVNGGFVASAVDGKPFLAPNRVTWSGLGSISDPSDAANWVGEVAPTATDTAYIPSGLTLTSNYAQVTAFFNNLAGVSFADETAGLVLTNGDVATTMTCPLYGKGHFTVAESLCTSSSSYLLTMSSANYMFAGTMLVSNAAVYVNTGGGRGANTPAGPGGLVIIDSVNRAGTDDKRRYTIQSGFQSCDYRIRRAKGNYFIIHENVSFYGDFDMNELVSLAYHDNGGHAFCIYGDYNYTNSTRISASNSNFEYLGGAGATKHLGLLQTAARNVSAPLAFAPQAMDGTISKQYNLTCTASASSTSQGLRFGLANALQTNVFLRVYNGVEIKNKYYAPLNLDGFDQRVGTLAVDVKESDFDPSAVWNEHMTIESAKPATLTIYGNCRCDKASAKHVYPGVVKGAASIVMASREDVNERSVDGAVGEIRFNCPGSDTTGTLTAESGTLEVMPTATFSNVTAVVASGDGLFKVGTADVGNATNLLVSVTNATTARIEIASGVTLGCDTAFMGNRWLDAGRYSSVAAEGVKACKHLSGTGILEVRRYGGKRGLLFLVK